LLSRDFRAVDRAALAAKKNPGARNNTQTKKPYVGAFLNIYKYIWLAALPASVSWASRQKINAITPIFRFRNQQKKTKSDLCFGSARLEAAYSNELWLFSLSLKHLCLLALRVTFGGVVVGADHCHVEVLLRGLGVALAHVLHDTKIDFRVKLAHVGVGDGGQEAVL
jgi:hypothetical protein